MRQAKRLGMRGLAVVGATALAVGAAVPLHLDSRLSLLTQRLIELTPKMKAKRREDRLHASAALATFRQDVRVGQQVFVADHPLDENYFGVVSGRTGVIVSVPTTGDLSVAFAAQRTAAVSRARLYPMDASVLSRR